VAPEKRLKSTPPIRDQRSAKSSISQGKDPFTAIYGKVHFYDTEETTVLEEVDRQGYQFESLQGVPPQAEFLFR
jgi:hypothetical protein